MAYRVRSLSTMTVEQVNEIFIRGRGLSLHAEHESRRIPNSPSRKWPRPDAYVAPATVIDDDLEAVR